MNPAYPAEFFTPQPGGSMDTIEQDFQRWWDGLPSDVRKRMTDYEASIGSRLSWNQRYIEVRKMMDDPGKGKASDR